MHPKKMNMTNYNIMKKKLITLATAAACVIAAQAEGIAERAKKAWTEVYPQVEARIKAPEFPDKDFNILKFGKKSKKEGYLYTKMINKAIQKCHDEGGGRVVVPAGTWLTGPITLLSNVNLHLEEGATLLFTTDVKEYPIVLTRWEGMDCYNYSPMIYAYKQENIAITGKGTIDGGASRDNWWGMVGNARWGWKEGQQSQRIGRPQLQEWNENGVPVEERKMGDGYGMRVQLVNPVDCKNVLIEDVTMLRAAFWVMHPLRCQNVTVRGVHVQNDGPNGDGCDPESCKDVLIENCFFDTGDDCIAIKSGRNRDGLRWALPSENIIVRNCYMKNGHGGVVIGSEISGGYKTLFVENCKMDSPELDRVIRIKTNPCRGGLIEDIYVRNVEVGQCKEAVLKINLDYEANEKCRRDFPPTVRNVYLENVNCNKSKYGVMIVGLKDRCNVYGVEVKDCNFNGVADGNNITGQVKDIVFDNLKINGVECLYGKPLAYKMAKSEMTRIPNSEKIDVTGVKWSYAAAVELEGILAAALAYDDQAMLDYVKNYADFFVNPDGSIKAFKKEAYNIDNVKGGTLLLKILDITGEPRYRMAADTIYSQLLEQPRTKSKNFWHKKIYPWQAWLDGLYMGQPFYAEYVNRYLNGDPKLWDDIANQFITVGKKTYDPKTGLYRHAWDEKRQQFWADKKTGQSKHAWGRAMGWYIWALTDVLEKMPEDNPNRPALLELLKSIADGVVKHQDPKTGVWYQVMDSPEREGNYLEATATAMFVYNLLRSVRLGFLDESYLEPAKKGYEGMVKTFIKENPDGTISLTNCCAVAGLGGGKSQRRDGTFEYYLSEPIRDNDAKGVGPFILSSLEYDNLKK